MMTILENMEHRRIPSKALLQVAVSIVVVTFGSNYDRHPEDYSSNGAKRIQATRTRSKLKNNLLAPIRIFRRSTAHTTLAQPQSSRSNSGSPTVTIPR